MTDRIVKIVLRGEVADFIGKMKASSSAAKATVDGLTDGSKESAKYRQNLSSLGDTAGKFGLVAAGGMAVAVRAFANFDQAMSAVAASGADARGSLDSLRQAALDAGARTQYSATEAAMAIENLAKAGVSASDILNGGLDGALDLAAAGSMDVAQAAEIAAVSMKQFGLDGDQASHVADLLAAGAGKAVGDVSDFGAALAQSGLVANQTGLSIEETTAALSAMAEAGLVGSDAGTSLKSTLQRLTPQSGKAKAEMEALGITAYDAQGNFVGLAEFAGNLQNALKDLSPEQRNAALSTIFGSDAVRAASVLYEQGEQGIRDWTTAVDDQGYAAETAAIKMDNLKGDVEQLGGALETAFIGTGEGADGPLRQLTQSLTGAVNAYNQLPAPIKSATVAALGLTAVLGGGLWFTAKTLSGVAAMRANLAALAISGSRASVALGAVAKAGAVLAVAEIGTSIADSIGNRGTEEIDKLGASLLDLVKTGKATGDLADLFGGDLGGRAVSFGKDLGSLGDSLKSLAGYADDNGLTRFAKNIGTATQAGGIYEQAEAVQDLDTALSRLNENDPEAAAEAFATLSQRAIETGASAADIKAAFPAASAAIEAASMAAEDGSGSIDGLGGAAGDAAAEVQSLSDSLEGLLSPLLDREDASNAYKDSLASLGDAIAETGTSLDDNTEAGRASQDAIRERVRALQESVAADEAAGVGSDELAEKLRGGARAILDAGVAAGISAGDMRKYLAVLGLTPEQIDTLIEVQDAQANADINNTRGNLKGLDGNSANTRVNAATAGANAGIIGVATQLSLLNGRVATVTVRAVGTAAAGGAIGAVAARAAMGKADGGIVDYYASGGIRESHVAQIAPAGAMRVWAEPETGGEAYIPFAQSKRKRSQQIAMETVSRLGGAAYFGNGGINGGGSPASPMSFSLVGAKVGVDKNGLMQFVDGRVELGVAGNENWKGAQRRAHRG